MLIFGICHLLLSAEVTRALLESQGGRQLHLNIKRFNLFLWPYINPYDRWNEFKSPCLLLKGEKYSGLYYVKIYMYSQV